MNLIYTSIISETTFAPKILAIEERDGQFYEYEPTHNQAIVNSIGEGQINVCGENGNIAVGDLIVTSSTAGKGMKQADDLIRSYTVAKAREAATFSSATDIKMIACIYVSG